MDESIGITSNNGFLVSDGDKNSGIGNDPNDWLDVSTDLIEALSRIVRVNDRTMQQVQDSTESFDIGTVI